MGAQASRLRKSTCLVYGCMFTAEEILAEDGLTLEDVDAMEDVEIE